MLAFAREAGPQAVATTAPPAAPKNYLPLTIAALVVAAIAAAAFLSTV